MSISTTGPNERDAGAAPDFAAAAEPFQLFETWFADAGRSEVNDPNAMALATVDTEGLPNVRMVLLKGLDAVDTGADRGFVFYTNYDSAKGAELLASHKAALLFHWKSLRRQVRIRGTVKPVTGAEADDYFKTRARGSRIGAWASLQSRPLDARATLEAAVAEVTSRYDKVDVPRPLNWSGFRVTPLEIEFWHDRPFRLHQRLVFRRPSGVGSWATTALYP